MNQQPLSWGLVVATYNRRDLLVRCVRQALIQTRPPSEIVIVDASAEFDENEAAVRAVIAEIAPALPLRYERAKRPQQTVQRNQGVKLAASDVLFMIDDDSLMYPTCAERIMQVYERPGCEHVVAVMAALHPRPPDTCTTPVASEPAEPPSRFLGLASWFSARLKGDFYPEFSARPRFPIPALGPGVNVTTDLHGARITVRRQVALREPFDEALLFNAHEDRDAAFRFRGLGVLAVMAEPLICHVEAVRADARRGFVYRGAWLLNYAYLVQKWCPDQRELARAYAQRFARSMLALDFMSSVRTREFHRVLGVAYVKRELLPRLLRASTDELSEVAMTLSLELRRAGQTRG